MRRWAAVVVLAVAAASSSTSCGGSDGPGVGSDRSSPPPSTVATEPQELPAAVSPTVDAVPLFLLSAPGWDLEDAVDLPVDHLLSDVEPIPSDWYAAYSHLRPIPDGVEQRRVTLTGMRVDVDLYVSGMEVLGYSFEAIDTPLGAGWAGTSGDENRSDCVLVVPAEAGALQIFSPELPVDELLELSALVRRVSVDEWVGAGGQIL